MREPLSTLVMAAQLGDQEAFGQIVRRFQDMAYAGAYTLIGDPDLAQDAAQEAFLDAYLSLPKLHDPAAFPGWFRRIVLKHSDRQRRSKTPETVSIEVATTMPSSLPDPVTLVQNAQTAKTVHDVITTLSAAQQMVLTLFYIQGYSYKEIAAFLELPVTAVKKRLFDARKTLKGRLAIMVQEHLQDHKPSQDLHFAKKVQFLIALKTDDMGQVEALIEQDPSLIQATTGPWPVACEGYYWPIGVTPLHWAAATGDVRLLTFLLSRGAAVNPETPPVMTPLHSAVLMGQTDTVRLLLIHGAEVNAKTPVGLTPLHHASMRQNREIVEHLVAHQADVHAVDHRGYRPVDWAAIKRATELVEFLVAHGSEQPNRDVEPLCIPLTPPVSTRRVPVGEAVLGRVLDGSGRPLDGQGPLAKTSPQPIYRAATAPTTPILPTGIKIVDLLAPLKWGGHHGVFTPRSGVGKWVFLGQLINHMQTLHHAHTVYLGLEEGVYTARSLQLAWREMMANTQTLSESIVHVFGHVDDSVAKRWELAETGLTIAESFRRMRRHVVLIVEGKLAMTEGIVPYLKTNAVSTPDAAITTIYHGDYTVGLEPEPFANLDAVLTFDPERAKQRLYPAIDPIRSHSKLFSSHLMDATHMDVATKLHRLLQRYQELHDAVERHGLESLFYLDSRTEDEVIATRARRLHRFLTQYFTGAEPWTGHPGRHVPLEETIRGCRAILDGFYDTVPEDAFRYIGTIDEVATSPDADLSHAR